MIIQPIEYNYPDLRLIKDKTSFFESMKEEYTQYRDTPYFKEGRKPAIFVYRIQTKTRIYHGILAGVDIGEYTNGNILKHENTLIEQEKKIIELTRERNAIIKPVLLAYKFNTRINGYMAKAFLGKRPKLRIKFEKENQIHELFAVEAKKEIKAFQKEFNSKVGKAYIADGHHRMSAVNTLISDHPELKAKGLRYITCALFSFGELDIFPYNRLIKILDTLDINIILTQLQRIGTVKKLNKPRLPSKKGEIIMHSEDGDYAINWHKQLTEGNTNMPVTFDIDIFNQHVVKDIFGITDIRSNNRIKYFEGNKGNKTLLAGVKLDPMCLGFSFYPVKKNHFIKIANKGLILPPKSTWFEPRIRNGIVVQKILSE